ncbi:PREDICTED: polypeptide N-acetylgalactosaminyltransferase 4-like [Branchiostoma belcheri]|uniref:Polypeptide N-acetylgalactosaminyltransferase n=1 Tax=Branchiostoma belcheri TaxID=7741 RepID=A0A6P5ABJ8_BRABE|nr:PREDICTED: polypeptide N-acetylgalactosaminyltransferase 4-like [Branchiostoma belcheri]
MWQFALLDETSTALHHENARSASDLKVGEEHPTEGKQRLDHGQSEKTKGKIQAVKKEKEKEKIVVKREPIDQTPHLKRPKADPSAPGEGGKGVKLEPLTPEEKSLHAELLKNNSFNAWASSKISLHRSLPDLRHRLCKQKQYFRPLPQSSVIIIFYNEAWSTLLRTVHSVLEATPAELLREVILVDDCSTFAHLQTPLEEYLSDLPQVRLVRSPTRQGLIRARLLGALHARGEVLTFLDSHCECMHGWMEPQLETIARNHSTVPISVLDNILHDTFQYVFIELESIPMGGINFKDLTFAWETIPEHERKRRKSPVDPIRSPTMAGGIFSINKKYFEHLGAYDTGMEVWGGENIEMSFRIWQCGGTIEILPCSHVGHVFRQTSPYSTNDAWKKMVHNTKRMAEVWMDDYKEIYYRRHPEYRKYPIGDLTQRKLLRKALHCRDFSWYLKHVYPSLYVPDIRPMASGQVSHLTSSSACSLPISNDQTGLCLDVIKVGKEPAGVFACHGKGGTQFWELTHAHEVRDKRGEYCLQASWDRSDVITAKCTRTRGDVQPSEEQKWVVKDSGLLYHPQTDRCLDGTESGLSMTDCSTSGSQRWRIENFNP